MAVCIYAQVSCGHVILLGGDLVVELLASVVSVPSTIFDIANCFPKWLFNFIFLPVPLRNIVALHPCQPLVLSVFLVLAFVHACEFCVCVWFNLHFSDCSCGSTFQVFISCSCILWSLLFLLAVLKEFSVSWEQLLYQICETQTIFSCSDFSCFLILMNAWILTFFLWLARQQQKFYLASDETVRVSAELVSRGVHSITSFPLPFCSYIKTGINVSQAQCLN